jgi:hypothetical protein
MSVPRDYLETADVWTVLGLIVAEFKSDPQSVQCFDLRLVRRATQLVDEHERCPQAEDDGRVMRRCVRPAGHEGNHHWAGWVLK